jgi:hypothetical protein
MRAVTGDGKGGEGGRQATATRETKRAREATAMMMATRVAGNKEGNGNGGKSNGDGC